MSSSHDLSQFQSAVEAWRQTLSSGVDFKNHGYSVDTSPSQAQILAVLRPHNVSEVQSALTIASRFRVKVYPVSTAHNWGYGTAIPPSSPSVILDLGLMNRILAFDEEIGIITLEPGVTGRILNEFLLKRGCKYLVPVTGAGPDCSILANALERGFGITPISDHFRGIVSLNAVLPNGEIYESALRDSKVYSTSYGHRWGMGPYLDGLFTQSNFGVVVNASLVLARRPKRLGVVTFSLRPDIAIEQVAEATRDLVDTAGSNLGGLNFISRQRLNAMSEGSARLDGPAARLDLARHAAWTGVGSVYGDNDHFVATKRLISRQLNGLVTGLRFFERDRMTLYNLLARLGLVRTSIAKRLEQVLDIVEGIPRSETLHLAYACSGRRSTSDLNPSQDGCGLYWYAPIVPFKSKAILNLRHLATEVCTAYGFSPALTLTTISPQCLIATLPILFQRDEQDEATRAEQCIRALYSAGISSGFLPYRIGSQFMNVVDPMTPAAKLSSCIKCALDPNGIVAPGRYVSANAINPDYAK